MSFGAIVRFTEKKERKRTGAFSSPISRQGAHPSRNEPQQKRQQQQHIAPTPPTIAATLRHEKIISFFSFLFEENTRNSVPSSRPGIFFKKKIGIRLFSFVFTFFFFFCCDGFKWKDNESEHIRYGYIPHDDGNHHKYQWEIEFLGFSYAGKGKKKKTAMREGGFLKHKCSNRFLTGKKVWKKKKNASDWRRNHPKYFPSIHLSLSTFRRNTFVVFFRHSLFPTLHRWGKQERKKIVKDNGLWVHLLHQVRKHSLYPPLTIP